MSPWHPLPASLYALVEHVPATVLLESARHGAADPPAEPHHEKYSRLFTCPSSICVANEPAEVPRLFAEIENAVAAGHFAAGFFSYECGSSFEPKAAVRPTQPGTPLAWFGIYERCHLFDHATGTFPNGDPPGLTGSRGTNSDALSAVSQLPQTDLALSEEQYAERIDQIHEWIRAGDIYQLNFTVPYRLRAPGSSAALYATLRNRQPVDYGAFLHWQPNRRILSFSPELFFQLESKDGERRIATRPMKGTAPRGRTTSEDRDLAKWLRNDPKNSSENVMIVDLLRNDLGRISKFGSVHAENLFAVERHPTLWQMTSTVTGDLRPEAGFHDIFRALFPCGSITGAPKVRAMQLLAGIEQEPRGVYTGAIGFFSRERTVFNVAIRTLEMDGEQGRMGVGSGIVIDSVASEEFRECLLKAEFLTRPAPRIPERFSLVETLLWQSGNPLGNYPFIELHLDRLGDSAHYFGFCCDRASAKFALFDHAATFSDGAPRKVRLLLDQDGGLHIANELLPEIVLNSLPARVRIAKERTDPQDPMLFHKTTHRPIYAKAFRLAKESGFDDVLFLNCRAEVTEGAISNIFVEKAGRWFTPPVECGLLAGIQRRHLLETQPGIEERVLYSSDLKQADAIYLANAVRGLRLVTVDWAD
jgi:para-aminobenzoate synthetase/4-amino-4-deoxychorismate lyase